jgi:signal transduction histidine kinase
MQRRVDLLAASNERLEAEIARRRAVEASLIESERRAGTLLTQSLQLQTRLRQISHQALVVQESQRKRISRELHDEISQLLVSIEVHLSVFAKAASRNPQGIRRSVDPLRRMVRKTVGKVHRFARELRPAMLDDFGLIPALRFYIDEFPKRKGRRIQFTADAVVENLDTDKRTVLYRIAQEALTNVDKHAQASRVTVAIRRARDCVCLEVTDDGIAFDVGGLSSAKASGRLGLTGMRERAEMIGGKFDVVSAPGEGTSVRAEIPLDDGGNDG